MKPRVWLVFVLALGLPLQASLAQVCGNGNVEMPELCDDGNAFGGDGCARNCSPETERDFTLDPDRSFALTQTGLFQLYLPLSGVIRFTTGGPGSNGEIPVTIRKRDMRIDQVQVTGLACACIRTQEIPFLFGPGNIAFGSIACGPDGMVGTDVTFTQDHNAVLLDHCLGGESNGVACATDTECPGGECFSAADCTSLRCYGGTNEGRPCPPGGCRDGYCLAGSVDRNPLHAGVCKGPPIALLSGVGPRGSAVLVDSIGFTIIPDGGTCAVNREDPLKGPDGIPCTDDDPVQGAPINMPFVTGRSTAVLIDADNSAGVVIGPGEMCGAVPCAAEAAGTPFDCDRIAANPDGGLEGGNLVLVFLILDYEAPGLPASDAVITLSLATSGEVPPETPVPTAAATPTAHETGWPTTTPTGEPAACPGDCNSNGRVTVDELVSGVNIALGVAPVDVCARMDANGNRRVEINELVLAVSKALGGC